MVDDRGLVAARVDSTGTWTGFALVEDIGTLRSGIENGSWVDGAIGGFASSMDVLATVMDPVGALASMGVAWLMEHVQPLSDALDQLAGDPDQIGAFAQTWDNVARAAGESAADLAAAVARDLADWAGAARQAYSAHAAQLHAGLTAAQGGASGVAVAVRAAGLLVALVRELVRDLVAECVATLLVRVPEWLAEVGLTLGFGTPWVIGQVSSLVAKWVGKIARLLDGLIGSLRRLGPMVSQLEFLLGRLRGEFDDLAAVGSTRVPAVPRRSADAVPDVPTTPAGGGFHAASPDAPPRSPSAPSSPATAGGYALSNPEMPPGHSLARPPKEHEGGDGDVSHGAGRLSPATGEPATDVAVQTGAQTHRPHNDYRAWEIWAPQMYTAIRANKTDVERMSQGLIKEARRGSDWATRTSLSRIKEHLFETRHRRTDSSDKVMVERFDPSPDIAEAWIRLSDGRGTALDRLLLQHEFAEMEYLKRHPSADYTEAHDYANTVANWQQAIMRGR